MGDDVEEISRLIAYAKELSFPLDIDKNFLTRFKLQKLAFLLRILSGEEIDDFNIYTHGPYSPKETEEELRKEAQRDVEEWTRVSSAAEDKDE